MCPDILTARDVRKRFGIEQALDDVTIGLAPGRVTCLIGKNGAGKTTLIKILLGMLLPDTGEVAFQGKPLAEWGAKYYHHASAVLEGGDNTYGFLTGRANLDYLGALSGLTTAQIRSRSAPYIEMLGLGEHLDKKAGEYSLGMRQKLAVIASVMTRPDVLLLDEPTLGLDVEAKEQVVGFVRNLADEQNTAILVTSHQSDVVARLADDVVVLDAGQVLFDGSAQDFRRQYGADQSRFRLDNSVAGRRAADIIAGLLGAGTDSANLITVEAAGNEGTSILVPAAAGETVWERLTSQHLNTAVIAYDQRVDDIESVLRALYAQPKRGGIL